MKKYYLIIALLLAMIPALETSAESYVIINRKKQKLSSRTGDVNAVINAFPPESIRTLEFLNVDGAYTVHFENMKHLSSLFIDSGQPIELKEWTLECPELMELMVANLTVERLYISNCRLLSLIDLTKCNISKEFSIVQSDSLKMLNLSNSTFASGTSIAVDAMALSSIMFAFNQGFTALPSFIMNAPKLKEISISAYGDNGWIDYEGLIKKNGLEKISIRMAPLPFERRASLKSLAKEYNVELEVLMNPH